jgi:hypothetical protein
LKFSGDKLNEIKNEWKSEVAALKNEMAKREATITISSHNNLEYEEIFRYLDMVVNH